MQVNIKYLVIMLFILSNIFLLDSYQNYEKSSALKFLIKNEGLLNNLLVQVGRERDLTALYMGSNYKNFDGLLQQQRVVLDKEIDNIKKYLQIDSTAQLKIFLKKEDYFDTKVYKEILDSLNKILEFRKKVELHTSDFKDIFFGGYTDSLSTPLNNRFRKVSNYTDNSEIIYCISLLNQLNIAKENTGLQRGFVAYFMEKSTAMTAKDIIQWEEFKSKSNSFQVLKVQELDIEKKIQALYNIPATKDMLLNIDDISVSIMVDAQRGKYKEDTTNWFTFQTQKISLFSKIEIILISQLEKKAKDILFFKQMILVLSLLVWIIATISLIWYQQKFKNENGKPLIEKSKNMKFSSVIAILTKIAYSKGSISHPEKDVINYTMNNFISMSRKEGLNDPELIVLKEHLDDAYRVAKIDDISISEHAHNLESCSFDMKVQILKQLVSMAAIDGYSVRKKMMIYEAVEAIGFDKLKIQKYINDIIGDDITKPIEDDCPYNVLGCQESDDDTTIKKKYREQIKEFHPDYIQGKGLNNEIIKFAEQKMKEINRAHEEIKKERKNNNT